MGWLSDVKALRGLEPKIGTDRGGIRPSYELQDRIGGRRPLIGDLISGSEPVSIED